MKLNADPKTLGVFREGVQELDTCLGRTSVDMPQVWRLFIYQDLGGPRSYVYLTRGSSFFRCLKAHLLSKDTNLTKYSLEIAGLIQNPRSGLLNNIVSWIVIQFYSIAHTMPLLLLMSPFYQ